MLQNLPFFVRNFRAIVSVLTLRAAAALTASALRYALLAGASHHCGGNVAVKRIVRISRIRDHVLHLLLYVETSIHVASDIVNNEFSLSFYSTYSTQQLIKRKYNIL